MRQAALNPRSTKQKKPDQPTGEGWTAAVGLVEDYLRRPRRADVLLGTLPVRMDNRERARCQHLFTGVLKNFLLLQESVRQLAAKAPRPTLQALLLVAGFELLEAADDGQRARVTDHAVGAARKTLSDGESRFANAVLRRLPAKMVEVPTQGNDEAERLSLRFSHPAWIVRRWLETFGEENTKALLQWNQEPAPVYIRVQTGQTIPDEALVATEWPDFYKFTGERWDLVQNLLNQGIAYAHDPSTLHPVELLDPKPGETVLDLCAAPGGKARQILSRIRSGGTLVALDLPGERFTVLKQNLPERSGDNIVLLVEADLLQATPELMAALGKPTHFDAVLLDAPCSNTGVLRRRADARWRLQESDIGKAAKLQWQLLRQAGLFVKPGGRLVYSTCSIECEENIKVAENFARESGDFTLVRQRTSFPWLDRHDGAGAFLFIRKEK